MRKNEKRTLKVKVLGFLLFFLFVTLLYSPFFATVFLLALALDWLVVDINFSSWFTHLVIAGVALVTMILTFRGHEAKVLMNKVLGLW